MKEIGSFFLTLFLSVVIILLMAGGPIVYWWDRRPPQTPRVHILFWNWSPKDSIGSQLAALQAKERAAAQHAGTVQAKQVVINQTADTHEQAAQVRIRTVTQTLIKEVHDAVPPPVDAFLPNGWVRLYNASALGLSETGPAAGVPDAAPSRVKESDALGVAVENNGTCLATAERLTALQAWENATAANQ